MGDAVNGQNKWPRHSPSIPRSQDVEIVEVIALGRGAAFGAVGALEDPDLLAVLGTLLALDARHILGIVRKRAPKLSWCLSETHGEGLDSFSAAREEGRVIVLVDQRLKSESVPGKEGGHGCF